MLHGTKWREGRFRVRKCCHFLRIAAKVFSHLSDQGMLSGGRSGRKGNLPSRSASRLQGSSDPFREEWSCRNTSMKYLRRAYPRRSGNVPEKKEKERLWSVIWIFWRQTGRPAAQRLPMRGWLWIWRDLCGVSCAGLRRRHGFPQPCWRGLWCSAFPKRRISRRTSVSAGRKCPAGLLPPQHSALLKSAGGKSFADLAPARHCPPCLHGAES